MRRDGPFVQARCGRTMEGIVWLEPGIYEYKFVINGERREEDPLNPHRVPIRLLRSTRRTVSSPDPFSD